ncbi:MAG: helix-turn-helix domain-containing protein [Bacteroidales bacterium]|nr:helix-turn-helix domain-containing protein [Bacteroidales bacterium]
MDKDRLIKAYNYLRSKGLVHTQKELAELLGKDKATISLAFKGDERYLTKGFAKDFCRTFTNISLEWLATGDGTMLVSVDAPKEDDGTEYRMIPIVHIDSVGGMYSENSELAPEYTERLIPMTDARQGDLAIYQSGDSMSPSIPSGSLLHIREVIGWQEYIGYGNVFVLLLDDGRRITKEIQRYNEDPKNFYWCVSYNPAVAPEELPKKKIERVFKVIQVLINKGW